MSSSNWNKLIAAIHETMDRGFFVAAGGGSELFSRLLSVPGASRTVLEARIPYSPEALTAFLGQKPEQFCSEETARRMAVSAWHRAFQQLQKSGSPENTTGLSRLFGFSMTATLATSREHRGEHRAFAAIHTAEQTISWKLTLPKGQQTRAEEESAVADWALKLLGEYSGLQPSQTPPVSKVMAPKEWSRILTGELPFAVIHRDGRITETLPDGTVGVFPGSFHPIHAGHCEMHRCAEKLLSGTVLPEIAIRNADKPPLDYVSIDERICQIFAEPNFSGDCILLTGLPFFTMKSAYFRNQTFVVGMDTLTRIADAKYHFGEPILLERSHRILQENGARFLVFGRMKKNTDGEEFENFDPRRFPSVLAALCTGVSESEFRNDLSSTQIRQKLSANGKIPPHEGKTPNLS